MSEPKTTTPKQVRDQFKVAENTVQNAMRAWSDLTLATFDMTFDAAEKSMHYNQEVRGQADRAMRDAMMTYRQMYQDGLKTWQGYVQGISEIFTRTI